jgi:hypothetical protein
MSMAKILDVVGKVARMEAHSAVIRGPSSDKAPDSASLHPGYFDRPSLPKDYGAAIVALKTPIKHQQRRGPQRCAGTSEPFLLPPGDCRRLSLLAPCAGRPPCRASCQHSRRPRPRLVPFMD